MHASQFQLLDFCAATNCWKPESALGTSGTEAKPNLKLLLLLVLVVELVVLLLPIALGLGVSQAIHLLLLL